MIHGPSNVKCNLIFKAQASSTFTLMYFEGPAVDLSDYLSFTCRVSRLDGNQKVNKISPSRSLVGLYERVNKIESKSHFPRFGFYS